MGVEMQQTELQKECGRACFKGIATSVSDNFKSSTNITTNISHETIDLSSGSTKVPVGKVEGYTTHIYERVIIIDNISFEMEKANSKLGVIKDGDSLEILCCGKSANGYHKVIGVRNLTRDYTK